MYAHHVNTTHVPPNSDKVAADTACSHTLDSVSQSVQNLCAHGWVKSGRYKTDPPRGFNMNIDVCQFLVDSTQWGTLEGRSDCYLGRRNTSVDAKCGSYVSF